jgi:hypothetical protein
MEEPWLNLEEQHLLVGATGCFPQDALEFCELVCADEF